MTGAPTGNRRAGHVTSHRGGARLSRRLFTGGACCAVLAALVIAPLGGRAASAADGRRGGGTAALVRALRTDLHRYLAARRVPEHISAVSLRLDYRGGPGINLAVGTTRYGGRMPVSPNALWQIGSNTKAFTSVMLLRLEAEGRLSIDDRLGKWLPQYPRWRNITIKRLLNMTSTIPDYVDQPAFLRAYAAYPRTAFTAARLLSYVYHLPLGKPGYQYSNTNYILAQLILEKATGHSYADQLMHRIIIPLHLHRLCYPPIACAPSLLASMPDGYFFDSTVPQLAALFGEPVPKTNLSYAQGAGGITSSLADMTTWDRALYQGEELPSAQQRQLESLVSITTGRPIRRTTLSDPGGYGLGVSQATTKLTGTVWQYEGETLGYRVVHVYNPRTGLIIALAANSTPTTDDLSALLISVYQTLKKAGALQRLPAT
jgi:D-alanyl-D-alanine carboxypeptidase